MCNSFADKLQRYLHKLIWALSSFTVAQKIHALTPRKEGGAVPKAQPEGVRRSGERGRWHTSCAHMAPGPRSLAESPSRSDIGNRPECCSLLLCSLRSQFAPICACISGDRFVSKGCACFGVVSSKTCSTERTACWALV